MRRKLGVALSCLGVAAVGARATTAGEATLPELPGVERHAFTRPLMGTEFRIVLHAEDSLGAARAADRAFARIVELEDVLSHYDPGSELSRLSETAGGDHPVVVGDDLWNVLSTARTWSRRTGGAFDVTVGPLTRLWRRAARRGSVPSAADIAAARGSVGYQRLHLNRMDRTVRLEAPGMELDAGGIGKGYAADAALAVLAGLGFPHALVDAGGDVVAGEPPPGEAGWQVALGDAPVGAVPGACVVPLANAALATSGDTERFVEIEDTRHSHILDPRTGAALTSRRRVTVLASTATDADILASALSVMTVPGARRLLQRIPGVAARIVETGEVDRAPIVLGSDTSPALVCPSDPQPSTRP